MPLVIEEMSATLEIQDEVKIRKLIKQVVREELMQQRQAQRSGSGADVDPADPAAGGSQESGGG